MTYKWDLQQAIRLVVDEKITNAGGISYQAMELVEGMKGEGHQLESVSWGGSPSSAKLPGEVQKRLGKGTLPAQVCRSLFVSTTGSSLTSTHLVGLWSDRNELDGDRSRWRGLLAACAASCSSHFAAKPSHLTGPTCAGLPTFVTSLKIIDEAGQELPTGEVGEILIKGPGVAVGYWRAPKATAETFDKEGWYHS